ncbi:hypothetical protein Tco_1224774 [Tanacetum coccineum]
MRYSKLMIEAALFCFIAAPAFASIAVKFFIMAAFFILDKLTEVAGSDHLQDKIKIMFTRTHSKDECFIGIVRDLCCGLRLSLTKNRRLVAELEALGHCADAVRCLGYLREMVGRDSETLGVLEQLLARAEVGRRLKASYADDIDKTE